MIQSARSQTKLAGTHERLIKDEEVKGSSDRSFGSVFAAFFMVIGMWPLLSGNSVRFWSLAIAFIFATLAIVWPSALAPLNRLWTRFGLILNLIVSPLVMGLLFYVVITPIALVMRATGKDVLRLRFDPKAKSYWIKREPPGPAPESIKNQF